eukprot:1179403-Prorocentrum_minimum.AAC.4
MVGLPCGRKAGGDVFAPLDGAALAKLPLAQLLLVAVQNPVPPPTISAGASTSASVPSSDWSAIASVPLVLPPLPIAHAAVDACWLGRVAT